MLDLVSMSDIDGSTSYRRKNKKKEDFGNLV